MSAKSHFDISAQQQTYTGFIKATVMSTIALVIFLVAGALFLV